MKDIVRACAVFCGLCLAGCASTHPAEINDCPAPYQAKSRVQWYSSNLKSLLEIDKADVQRTPDGRLHLRLAIRNQTRKDIWVDIRTVFTDDRGFEREKTNWEPICLTARVDTTYEVFSLGTQVCDYQIVIRDPRKLDCIP
ncbi:MAG: hypothetical protein KBH81_10060 [Phycisphaerae bacterium]|nr:hypothetical protein [Phycisphaerae bacterium]